MERFIYTSNDNITPFYYPVEVRPLLPLASGPADRFCTQFDDLSLDRTQIPGWFREHEAEWEIWRNWANVTINVERMERYVLSGAYCADILLFLCSETHRPRCRALHSPAAGRSLVRMAEVVQTRAIDAACRLGSPQAVCSAVQCLVVLTIDYLVWPRSDVEV